MPLNAKDFYTNLNKYLRWNPDHKYIRDGKVYTKEEGGEEAEIFRDKEGLIKWLKQHFHNEEYFELVGEGDVKFTAMPLGNLVLTLCPDVDTTETFRECLAQGIVNNGRYKHVLDAGDKYIEALQNVLTTAQSYSVAYHTDAKSGTLSELADKLSSLSAPKKAVIKNILEIDFDSLDFSGIDELQRSVDSLQEDLTAREGTIESLKGKLSKAMSSSIKPIAPVKVKKDGPIPSGELKYKPASELFDTQIGTNLEVPYWEWEHEHPDVPDIDENYIFRPDLLQRVLYCLVTGDRGYLQGHTGSGKTTLIEQVAARLNCPFARINFDSEVTRMDLIGRDQLAVDVESGTTKSHFVDGILPRVMSGPYITCFDEIDFCRPDVAYVMQAALENNSLRITEDGDRIVTPHPAFRMFATGNTVGQGDEHGMYQGARAQSLALLDRFTVWMRVPYLDDEQRASLLEGKFPLLEDEARATILLYVKEHLAAFEDSRVLQPLSPRGILAIANATQILGSVKEALNMVVLDKASEDDRATLVGLVDRVV